MSAATVISRITPYARLAVEDDEFRARVGHAISAGRSALLRPAPPPTRVQRAGAAVRELGSALNIYGRRVEKRRRAERRARRARTVLIGTGAVALPVVIKTASHRASRDAHEEVSHG